MADTNPSPQTTSDDRGVKSFLVMVALLLLVIANAYVFWRVDSLEKELAKWRGSAATEVSAIQETMSASAAQQAQQLEGLRTELGRRADASAGQARTQAQKHAEKLAKQLAEEQRKQQEQIATELTEVKQTTDTATAKIADEVNTTKGELDRAITDLKRVTGDMGVMSGRIATNSHELAALRAFGERNYFEFTLKKTKQPQRIANIRALLKKADPKGNKYTIELYADDKRVEKKDKNANEPVQFYVAGGRQPYEIVVNEVKKDVIIGYLAAPKMELARK